MGRRKIKISMDKYEVAKFNAGEGGSKDDILKFYLDPSLARHLSPYCSIDTFQFFHEKSKLNNEQVTKEPTFENYGLTGNEFKKIATRSSIFGYLGGITGIFLFAYCFSSFGKDNFSTMLIIAVVGPGFLFAIPLFSFLKGCYRTFSPMVKKCNQFCQSVREYSKSEIDFWRDLSWRDFEKEVSCIFKRAGFNAYVTKGSGDKGVDVVFHYEDRKFIIQCKQYNKAVGPSVVRELLGIILNEKASIGIIVGLSGFTQGSYDIANSYDHILLWDIEDLISLNNKKLDNIFGKQESSLNQEEAEPKENKMKVNKGNEMELCSEYVTCLECGDSVYYPLNDGLGRLCKNRHIVRK